MTNTLLADVVSDLYLFSHAYSNNDRSLFSFNGKGRSHAHATEPGTGGSQSQSTFISYANYSNILVILLLRHRWCSCEQAPRWSYGRSTNTTSVEPRNYLAHHPVLRWGRLRDSIPRRRNDILSLENFLTERQYVLWCWRIFALWLNGKLLDAVMQNRNKCFPLPLSKYNRWCPRHCWLVQHYSCVGS